jgi:hypothetical protein
MKCHKTAYWLLENWVLTYQFMSEKSIKSLISTPATVQVCSEVWWFCCGIKHFDATAQQDHSLVTKYYANYATISSQRVKDRLCISFASCVNPFNFSQAILLQLCLASRKLTANTRIVNLHAVTTITSRRNQYESNFQNSNFILALWFYEL